MRSPRRTRVRLLVLVLLGAVWLSATLALAALWTLTGAITAAASRWSV